MSEKAKAVIIIGLREQYSEVEPVQSLGYRTILFNSAIGFEEALSADVPVEIDLNNEEYVLNRAISLSQQFDIQAVYTLNEYRVPLAARIREALGLSGGISYEAALNCRHKKRTRQLLARQGIGSARFTLVKTPAEAIAALADFSLPVVVKPSNDSGAHLVARCHTPEEVWQAVATIQERTTNSVGQAIDPEILLEEYLEGEEFSVEACTVKRQTVILAITAKEMLPPPAYLEIGYTTPAPLSETDDRAIRQLVSDALSALGVSDTVTHTEVRLTPSGPKILEVNARPGGDCCKTSMLVRSVTGYDLRELSLHLALGGNLADAPRHPIAAPSVALRVLVAEQDGIAVMNDPDDVARIPGVQLLNLNIRHGDRVVKTTNSYNNLGSFLVYGTPEQNAAQIAELVKQRLALRAIAPVLKS
jgi:biotin carboxylase